VTHLERCAEHGDPDPAIGGAALAALLGAAEGRDVDLAAAAEADAEEARLRDLLASAADRLAPRRPVGGGGGRPRWEEARLIESAGPVPSA
jgi:hypothetical protein